MRRSRFRTLLFTALTGPIVLLSILALTFLLLIRWMNRESNWVDHTDQVIAAAERTQGLLIDMETGVRGYLLTHNDLFLTPYRMATADAGRSFGTLKTLVSDNPDQYARAEQLRQQFDHWKGAAQTMIEDRWSPMGGQVSAREKMDALRRGFDDFISIEEDLRAQRRAAVARVMRTVIAVTSAGAILLGLLVGYLTRRALLMVAGEYTHALAESERSYREAESASRAKDEFLATLSHEIRTPLTAILGWARLLQMQEPDEDMTTRALDAIERAAKAQATLIDDILDVSRAITGKLRLDVRDVNVATAIDHALAAIRPAADAKEIAITTSVDGAITLRADPNRLQQIIWNLLSNAVKFSPQKSRIDVKAARQRGDVVIIVADQGRGIDASFLPYVFDRFRQADATSTRDIGGLGIGLSVVKLLAELHGGSVRAESPGLGKGATFTVVLPVGGATMAEMNTAHSPAVATEEQPLAGNDILIVDDDSDARTVIGAMLETFGARLSAAASVAEAMPMLGKRKFAAVVSDIAMPDESGFDLVRRLRASNGPNRDTPVIAVTALTTAAAQDSNAHFAATLHKPVDPSDLAAAVASVVS